jgi:DNA-binding transcriptional MerR regulator
VNTEKSPEAFRTISEVADWLGTPAHVLRFWESRFPQIKPVKRAGGRRYYRPADMELLGGIKKLLHDDGLTIRGVQKLLREGGVRRVADLSPPLAPDLAAHVAAHPEPREAERPAPARRGPVAGPAPDAAPDAPMAEDLVPAPQPAAEVVPLVLQPRQRTEAHRTPDLFDLPAAEPADPEPLAAEAVPDPAPQVPAPYEPAPADPVGPVGEATWPDPGAPLRPSLRMPPIPPDPADGDALAPGLPRRPALPRRTGSRPDDRLVRLFHRLADLRTRMDRPDP